MGHASALRRFQQDFAARLLGRDGDIQDRLPPGFAIHRSNVRVSLRQALAATFPVVGQLVGEGFFEGMADAFVEAQPPRVGWLSAYGEGFPDFIASYPAAQTLGYLADVARIEWARVRAANAHFDPGLDLKVLASLPPHRLEQEVLTLPAGASVIASRYPVFDIWQAHQVDNLQHELQRIRPTVGGQTVLVTRIEPSATAVGVLGPGDAALLLAARLPSPLASIYAAAVDADPDYDLAAGLCRLVDLKALSLPDALGWARPTTNGSPQ
jgi:hypothetical protein